MRARIRWARTRQVDGSSVHWWFSFHCPYHEKSDACSEKIREQLNSNHIVPKLKSGYQSVIVRGEFSALERTLLVGHFSSNTYRVIIENHILPFMYDTHGGLGSVVLQEDSCGSHRAKFIATYLQNGEVANEVPRAGPRLESDCERLVVNEIKNEKALCPSKKSWSFD